MPVTIVPPDGPDPLWHLLNADAAANYLRVAEANVRYVHYTSAENALKILCAKEIWLRNVTAMNDYTEVDHGIRLLQRTLDIENGSQRDCWPRLERILNGLSEAVITKFNLYADLMRYHTYTFCVSEHTTDEDEVGRLSMWRAYAHGGVGVGIVMNSKPFTSETPDGFEIFATKIEYASDQTFERVIRAFVNNVEVGASEIKKIGIDQAAKQIAFALCRRAVSAKHPGFHEEHEWRVVLNDKLFAPQICRRKVETVKGVPQVVYKLPIRDYSEFGIEGAAPTSLIDRIIIGPCEQGILIKDAFVEALTALGVAEPDKKIKVSDIPIR